MMADRYEQIRKRIDRYRAERAPHFGSVQQYLGAVRAALEETREDGAAYVKSSTIAAYLDEDIPPQEVGKCLSATVLFLHGDEAAGSPYRLDRFDSDAMQYVQEQVQQYGGAADAADDGASPADGGGGTGAGREWTDYWGIGERTAAFLEDREVRPDDVSFHELEQLLKERYTDRKATSMAKKVRHYTDLFDEDSDTTA